MSIHITQIDDYSIKVWTDIEGPTARTYSRLSHETNGQFIRRSITLYQNYVERYCALGEAITAALIVENPS